MFTLVEPGAEIRQNADPGILTPTHNYLLTYAEGKGEARITAPDGSIAAHYTVPKGFSLVRQDTVRCADGYDQTFAELSDEVKNRISHRARALIKLRDHLRS